MKTRAAALSSDAVCNLTAGSASLPFTKPGLFWKSCDLVWRRACQFQQPLKTFFLLENLYYSVAERELKLWGRSGTEGTSAFQSGQRVLLSNFAFHLCCFVVVFFIPSLIVFFFFNLFFIIKQERDRYRSSILSSLRGVCTSARLCFSSRFSIMPRRPQWMPVLIRPVSCQVGLGAWKGSSPPSSAPATCWHVAGKAKLV